MKRAKKPCAFILAPALILLFVFTFSSCDVSLLSFKEDFLNSNNEPVVHLVENEFLDENDEVANNDLKSTQSATVSNESERTAGVSQNNPPPKDENTSNGTIAVVVGHTNGVVTPEDVKAALVKAGTDEHHPITVTFEPGVKEIGEKAFYCYAYMISVQIPEGVTSIGNWAFPYAYALTDIVISNSVVTIGESAFLDCDSLTRVMIPANVTSIGEGAFSDGNLLKQIYVDDKNENYTDINGVLFNKEKTELCIYPAGRTEKTYTVPDGITAIGASAFTGNNYLNSINLPDGLERIEKSAFSGCFGLTGMVIPEGTASIDDFVFWQANAMKNLTIPQSVTSIGGGLFGSSWVDYSIDATIHCHEGSFAQKYAKDNRIKINII